MPSQPEQPRQIDDIHELVGIIELSDVFYWEERSRRVRIEETDVPPSEGQTMARSTNALGVTLVNDGTTFGIFFRFRMVFNDGQGAEFVADIEARYALPEQCEVAEEVQREFATRVAFMAIYPYLRLSIQTMAMRLGVPAPVLGIVRQDSMSVTSTLDDNQVRQEFEDRSSELPSPSKHG